jgi:ribosomal protein S18 acetylase RimI-like enzyme
MTTGEHADVVVMPAQETDVPELSRVLARAFADDPFMGWFMGEDRGDEAHLADFFKVSLQLTLPQGEVRKTSDGAGVALWAPPGGWHMDLKDEILLLPAIIRLAGLKRTLPVITGLDRIERQHPRAPHWYLMFLAVDPDHQGQGIGGALMQSVLQRCDQEGTPAYLETANERTLHLYGRQGFAVTREIMVTDAGPRMWCLWREPQG